MMKCKVCGREYSKWRFCLACGSINHTYTNKNYIGEGENDYCQDYLHVEGTKNALSDFRDAVLEFNNNLSCFDEAEGKSRRRRRQINYDMTDQQE